MAHEKEGRPRGAARVPHVLLIRSRIAAVPAAGKAGWATAAPAPASEDRARAGPYRVARPLGFPRGQNHPLTFAALTTDVHAGPTAGDGPMSATPDVLPSLRGRCVLLADDRFPVALEFWRLLADEGGSVLGPAPTLDEAFRILARTRPDAAVVAPRLDGMSAAPLAAALARRGVPTVCGPLAAAAGLDVLRQLPLRPRLEDSTPWLTLERSWFPGVGLLH